MDAELLIRAAGGVRMIADPPDPNGRALASSGLWEWNVGAAIRANLGPGDVFVDVGANAGYYSALAALVVGNEGHVYAIEPAPSTFLKLERNLALNSVENVTALAVAAGAAEGSASLYGPASGHDPSSSLLRRFADAVDSQVPVRPLHRIVEFRHRDRLKLIKVDVEGYEDAVLRGLEPLLEDGVQPLLLVEVHASLNADAPAVVADFCERHRLRTEWLVEDEGIDDHLAPADRQLVVRDLGAPPDLSSVPRSRYALLLTPSTTSPALESQDR
jgi:FkbM family methyltransferase